ncbi:unnamed protein product [Ceutorhynchus assimilis]|uniref:Mediator of DNA damage checkpoint protein 1 n=1 Tax=Ceutorhynchus assimilis TaxID=467358 RepID=A0A9N9MN42_9CUCU|nr:unnamed protein product [Ceutorhynchus assimilis]
MARKNQSQVAQLRLGSGNFSIYEGVNTIGRNRDATVNIRNMNISQHHAIIVVLEGEHYISDLNSSNHCFCEGTKMEPYKLYKLRNRIEITLGGLSGIYVTNAAFFEGSKPSHSTTLASQTFYGSNTQPLDNFVEDIHEVPTQEISWTNIKIKNDESATKISINHAASSDNQETDDDKTVQDRMSFFEEPTQVFDIRQSMRNKCQKSDINETINKSVNINGNMTASTSKPQKIDNLETVQEEIDDNKVDLEEDKGQSTEMQIPNGITVCENDSASTGDCEKLDYAKTTKDKESNEFTDCEEDKEQATTSTSGCGILSNAETAKEIVTDARDDELTDCKEDALSSNHGKIDKIEDKSAQNDDEELTDCEEDKEQATTSTSGCGTLVNVGTAKEKTTDAGDDELTDCEEDALFSDHGKIAIMEKKPAEDDDDVMTDCDEEAPKNNKPKSDDDEMTDCEESDKAQLTNKKRKVLLPQTKKVTIAEKNAGINSDDSNESMEFFKVDQVSKSSGSDESSVFLGFETPVDPTASNRPSILADNQNTGKSGNIQENQKNDKSTIVSENQDSDDDSVPTLNPNRKEISLMAQDDSYLENQMKKSTINVDADDEIPATQYQMLNGSDLVPSTPQINANSFGSKKATRVSCEESFKLDISDYSGALQKSTRNESVQDIFNSSNQSTDAPGIKTNLNEFSEAVTPEIQPCGSKDTNLDDLDFLGPTQQVGISFTRKNFESENLDETDCFVGPTQKIEIPSARKYKIRHSESKNTNLDDSDFFAAPTQKIVASQSNIKKKHNLTADEDFYDAPTQKVAQEDDSFLAPIRKSARKKSKKEEHVFEDDEDIYDSPTQKVTQQDNIFLSPTGNSSKQKTLNLLEGPLGIHDAPNQHDASTEDEGIGDDDVFIGATQKLNSTECNKDKFDASTDIFDVVTQIVPMEQEKVENIDGDDTFSSPTQPACSDTVSKPYAKDKHEKTTRDESSIKSPQKDEKKKTFSFKKSHLDATISDLAEAKTSKKAEETKIEKLTIKKTKEQSNKIEKLSINDMREPDNLEDDKSGRLSIKDAKELDNVKETKTKKRVNKKTTKLENVTDNRIEKLTIKKASKSDSFEEDKIVKCSKKKAESSDNGEYNKIGKLTTKKTKETANIEEAKTMKLTIKKNKKMDNAENNAAEELIVKRDDKTEKLTIKKDNESEETKLKKLSIRNEKMHNAENYAAEELTVKRDDKTEKLTIKKGKESEEIKIEELSVRNEKMNSTIKKKSHKFLNDDEHLIPKFLTESTSNIIKTESTSFNASNSEQNKSLALLESKFNKTKKSVKSSEEIKIKVPKNRQSKSVATVEEVQLEIIKRTSKRAAKKTQEVPAKKIAKNDNEEKVSKTRTRKVAELESESKTSKQTTKNTEKMTILPVASTSTNSISEDKKMKTTRGKNRQVEEANVNNENSEKSRAGPSRSAKSKKRQFTDDDDDAGVEATASPTKKQKMQSVPESPGTALKGLRKQKPKVVFTMMESPKLESFIKQLGGSIVDSVESCTVLITENVKRTQKLLTAIGLGKPICSPNWITESKKVQEFLDPWDYILTDPEAEKKWSFSLKQSLTQSRDLQLLRSYNFFIQVTNAVDVLKGAIESCGGKILPKIPSTPSEGTYIISSPENRSKYSRILKKNPDFKIIEAEAVFDGVLRQELRFDRHLLM